MRKKTSSTSIPACASGPNATLAYGTVTPEMQDILGSMENHHAESQEETEKILRDR